jgi:hypothetical protein
MSRSQSTTVGARSRVLTGPPLDERGAVTAEAAMVIPVLAVLGLLFAWMISVAVTEIRVVDAACETARAAARDDSRAAALGAGQRVAPDGAHIALSRGNGTVTARVEVTLTGPFGLLAALPPVHLHATAVTASEQP